MSRSAADRAHRQIQWYNLYSYATRDLKAALKALKAVRATLATVEAERDHYKAQWVQTNIKVNKVKELLK